MVRETRHLWVGNLPENVREEKIIEHFKRYGRVESVKVLPKRGSEGGVAAFVDFVDIKSAQKAHNSINKMGDRDLRTDYNEPVTIPSAARGLDDSLTIATRGRDVSGFTRGAGGPVYGPPVSLHSREGRFERRLDGAADGRERSYDHSAYGHHERSSSNSSSFDRQRHYETDYYRDSRDRALSGASGSIVYYGSRSRSPSRFETTETRYEPRAREAFTLASVVHRDLYREERGRRGERTYHHSRSRSPHSSQSHNPSPQRLPSQAARPTRSHSGSGSHSRSSSSDSVSSTSSSGSGSSDSSSSSSGQSPARSVQSAAVPAPPAQPLPSLDKDEPRKSFGIKVQNLPVRSTDTSLKDGLFHEFKKHGKVTSVQIHGASEERYGLVFFRQQEDQEKALSASKGKLFFGMQIDVIAWHGPETESENEFRPLDERIDEFHPKATRTLFIGNLEKTTTYHDLLNIFQRFGEIVDIDIKKVNGSPQYAFLQYCDIASVCKAIKKMDGEYLGNNRLKLGFGKSMPTTCVWLDGLSSSITEQYLTRHFCRYGHVVKVVFDRLKGMALILYNNIEYAQAAVKETKGWKIGGNKIKVDFANQESQMAFYRSMQASGQDIRDFYEITNERRDERRPPYHEFTAERAYYENVRAPGSYTEDPRRKYPARSREFYSEWDPYQGDYYDPRYYDDPREYRDYRDPYEQDIRKYSYLQRERERERERFETDRERDHGRRTIEHNQSPSHPRRPASPAASPSLSERPPSDSEHQVYSRSSERSGSCSSLSPPRFEKPDKIHLERHNRSDKSEKDKSIFEAERGNGGEKDKRAGRKEKGDKDRTEKQKLRKLKLASPTVPTSEPDLELDRDISPEASLTLRGKSSKSLIKDKDYSGKGKLDLPPCVVQLTRVKEKEVKLIDSILGETQKTKVGSDPVRSPTSPPSSDHKSMPFRIETQARDVFKHGKHLKEKGLASQVEVVDKEGNVKNKKYFKTDLVFDTSSSVEADRLAARKRRFEETSGKADHLKRISQEEDEGKLRRIIDEPLLKDFDYDIKMQRKEVYKREKMKPERMVTVSTTKEELDTLLSVGPSLDLQARLGEPTEEATDPLDSLDQKTGTIGAHSQPSFSLAVSDDGSVDMEFSKDQEQQHLTSYHIHSSRIERDSESKERFLSDIDHSQSCRKQMEQNRRLQQQLLEYDKSDKTESTPSTDAEDFEHRSLVHEVGKPPQDVTDNSPPSKRKKSGPFEFDFGSKRARDYQRFKHINDEPERRLASLPGTPFAEDASQLLEKEPDSPVAMNKNFLHFDVSKYNIGNSVHHGLSLHAEILKVKTSVTEEEFCWESNIRQGTLRGEMSFPTSIVKRESIRKRPERELEPGEVQSDSDEDSESRHLSLKPNSFNREDEERLSDVKSSESLEKNKFYEFALDKTITPDTKALLERAKSLSSSREENWSFLGHDSKFKSFRNSTDKEKSEPTPRPIPSWYMKKKKIRSDSDGKLDDKKKDAKPDEQERQELFASRFLHSSIFEQDSRRLQHLERKNNDPEVRVGRDSITSDSQVEQVGAGGSDLSQEPRVLFHSRFLELQQRDKNQQLPVSEGFSLTEEEEEEKTLDEECGTSPNVSEISQDETELAAAIDSITAEDISGDADGFSAPTTYTALLPTPGEVLPVSSEVIEPETDLTIKTIVESEQGSVMIPDSKSSQTSNTDTSLTESPLSEAAKKGGRARPKTPKKFRGRKVSLNRKLEFTDDAVLEPESTIVKLPESIPEEIQTANPKAATSAAAAAVVTVAAACKHEATATVTCDTPKEAEQPAVDQPEPQESAFHSGNNSPSYLRTQQPSPEPVAPALISPTTCLNSPASSKTPLTHPEWNTRTDEKGIPPKPQVSVALSTPGVGGPPANPPMPPDTKASDIDPSSSTLRKILMEPKYVSASNSNAVPSMQFTTTTADARISDNENSVEAVLPLKTSLLEDRPSPITQLVPRTTPPQPPPLQQCESPQILKEKLAITSTATSVISRIPMPFDFEDTPRISLSNRSSGMSLPKQKYRTSLNDNSRYHGLNPSDDGGSVGRPVVESTHCNTGSSTGLRVNTSEGVVVLSYSGQKTEGPQRIIAKISQIPPASAVDIEFQQSVTKSQIKQEPPPHPSTPKGSQTPTGYGHAGVVLAGQTFSPQPVISSIKQESPSFEKSEPSYHTGQQGGSVKTYQQSTSHPQLLRYGLSITQQQHIKKNGAAETVSIKAEIKPSQTFNIKPVLSPHHPSLAGNHILTSSAPHERVVSQPKQDSHSPRVSGHSTSPFPKVCPPTSSVVLGPTGPISQYVSNIHHAEQSVIMPPHSVTQSVPIGHLSQGDVRASTPSLSGIGYGIRSENLLSPRSAPPQRSTTPQPAVIRDVVLKSHSSSSGDGQVVGTSNDDMQSLPQGLRRASAPQIQPESIVMQPEFKGLHHRALRLDQYARDLRMLVHQHLTDHPGVVESRQTRTPETMQSSSHISSASSKVSPVVKNAPQTVRDASKAMELKMPLSPHSDNRIIGHPAGSVMVSPQGVQLIHPGNANSMSEYYREMRGFHPQYSGHSVIGINLANRGIAASQVRVCFVLNNPNLSITVNNYISHESIFYLVSQIDHGQRHKVPSVSSIESVGSFGESKLEGSHIRHPSSMDLCQISRVQGETGSPSYTSPVTITPKLEMPITVQKGPQGPISNQMPPPSSVSSQMRSDFKLDHTGLRSVDMVQLLTKYPIIWQGHLALKNDTAAVQLHFVSGNNVLAHRSLPPPEGGAFLRIAQRMRLEASQLEGVARRMTAENEYCLLLALPCGLDQEDVHNQTHALKTGFITYLQAKQAAGIINVPNPGSNQPAYVVQIFPPCEFSESHLSHLAPDLLNSISSISPHLMIVIASV
uniref:Msx2-interacting protein n=1 Tax=Cyprinus carpio TaxID=7962 RepID=A0A8C2GBA9_CYPCA